MEEGMSKKLILCGAILLAAGAAAGYYFYQRTSDGPGLPRVRPEAVAYEDWLGRWSAGLPVTATLVQRRDPSFSPFFEPSHRRVYEAKIEIQNRSGRTLETGKTFHVVEVAKKGNEAGAGDTPLEVPGAQFTRTPLEDYTGATEWLLPPEPAADLFALVVLKSTTSALRLYNGQTRDQRGGYVRLLGDNIHWEEGRPGESVGATYGSAAPDQSLTAATSFQLGVMVKPSRLEHVVLISPEIIPQGKKAEGTRFRYLLTFTPAPAPDPKKPSTWTLAKSRLVAMSPDGILPLLEEKNAAMWQRIAASYWAEEYAADAAEATLLRIVSAKGAESDLARVFALVTLWAKDKTAAVGPSLTIAQDTSERAEMRQAAVEALGALKEKKALPLLLELADGKDTRLSEAAIRALGRLEDAAAVDPLLRILENNARTDHHSVAADALAQLGEKVALDLDRLVKIARDPNAAAAPEAVEALGRLTSDQAAAVVLELAQASAPRQREASCRGLARMTKAEGRAALRKLLADEVDSVRRAAAQAIDSIKDEAEKTALMREALKSPHRGVREQALFYLSFGRGQRYIAEVSAVLNDPKQDAELRHLAAEVLGGTRAGAALDGLLAATKDADASVRGKAAENLGLAREARGWEAMMTLLSDRAAEARAGAATGLGNTRDPRAVEALLGSLKDGDERVRAAAATALGRIGDARATEALVRAQADEYADVHYAASEALERVTHEPLGTDTAAWRRWWSQQQTPAGTSARATQ
jgi:HEAT repeat protein